MRPNTVVSRILLAFVSLAVLSRIGIAQHSDAASRIKQAINETKLTVLKGNTYPLARPQFDGGSAPSNLQLNRMLLVLRRGPEQETALDTLLNQQQDKSSPNYHAWRTPIQFGQQFGLSDQDIRTITLWLRSHDFQVNRVANGRVTIEFSGTAGQVNEAFHTEIHRYSINGEEHWANSADPQIPTALTPVVAGIVTLHNFPRKPLHRVVGVSTRQGQTGRYQLDSAQPVANPLLTGGGGCGLRGGSSCYALGPYDFATIYNVLPLWNAASPIDGTGQTIAIVSQSDIYPQDFSDFRSDFGLPPGTLNIIYNGPNPGKLASQGDELESDLDTEWSGAVAKGATIDLVVSASTNVSAGVDLSAEYIVDNNVAPVMSESYEACELDLGTNGNQFYNQLWQQAAAEGITVFVAAGDAGPAACDRNSSIAAQGLSVNGISSTPYNIAVGGTDFNDSQNPSAYWNSTNNPVTLASAKSYIPETTWNDSCTNSEFFPFTGSTGAESDCNDSSSGYWPGFLVPAGGSGGASNCTTSANQSVSTCSGGYAKPLWQAGPGVPNDNSRDVPDVSLFAGDGLNSSFYLVCELDIYSGCAGETYTLVDIGGTSASAPTFAGIMAMVNQKTQSRQGNANYVMYPLAAQLGASCNSGGAVGSSCIFYDVTTGTIAMPCTTGSPDCLTNVVGDQNGVLSGYAATAGYDLATGLGSVNASNLVNNWSTVSFQPTVSTLSLNPTQQITHGSPVNVNVTVAPSTGTGTPTGLVALLASKGPEAGTFTLANGSVATTTGLLPGGSYTVMAHYAGDGTYAASDSSPAVAVTVNPEPSTTTVQALAIAQNGTSVPFTMGPYGGSLVYVQANVSGQSGQGVPTGTVNLTQTLNGTTTNVPGDPYPLNSEGLTLVPQPQFGYTPGTYSFLADYSGDASFNSNTSQAVSFTITKASTTTAESVPGCSNGQCVFYLGGQITIAASVLTNPSAFTSQPTGTMTFYSNTAQLGSPVSIDSSVSPPYSSIVTNQLVYGQNSITAQYSGDTNYSGSTSTTISIDMVTHGPAFTITANPMTVSVGSPGKSGSTTLTFAAQTGFTGSAMLSPSMCSNLPSKSSCSFSPASINFTSSATTVPVTLTITTTASSSIVPLARRFMPGALGPRGMPLVCILGVCILLLRPPRRRRWVSIPSFLALIVIASAVGCGGGGTGGGGGGGGNPGTPVGNYTGVTVTVTINGFTQSISNLTVDVQ
jgi:subtilase family serine protease